jgi:hypothetical protein
MNGFVSKPVRKRKLVETILGTLTGEIAWSPGIAPEDDLPARSDIRGPEHLADATVLYRL